MEQAQLTNSLQTYFNRLGHDIDLSILTLPVEVHAVSKGDYLFQQGDVASNFYFLSTGLVRYVSVSDEGKEFTQSFVKGSSVIGSTKSMVTKSKASFGIQALEESIVLSYPWAAFYEQMREDKNFLEFYVKLLERIFISKEERESAFMKHSAERRYLDFCVAFPELKDTIQQQQIASYIGITPVALSRIRQKLKLC